MSRVRVDNAIERSQGFIAAGAMNPVEIRLPDHFQTRPRGRDKEHIAIARSMDAHTGEHRAEGFVQGRRHEIFLRLPGTRQSCS